MFKTSTCIFISGGIGIYTWSGEASKLNFTLCMSFVQTGFICLVTSAKDAFSWRDVRLLVWTLGIMNQHLYMTYMTYIIPFSDENIPVSYVFQHVKDPKDTSRMVIFLYLSESIVTVMEWPD